MPKCRTAHLAARLLAAAALCAPAATLAAGAHQHGVATLTVAVAPDRSSIVFESPLHDLIGFERAPRNEAERARVAALAKALGDAAALFAIDPAAGCTALPVLLRSAPLGLGPDAGGKADAAKGAGKDDGHGDLEAEYGFSCRAVPAFVEQRLFEAFKGLKRIEVQIATPRGQMKATLRRGQGRIALTR